ncbi:hypothetical protein CFOL_v3_11874, partial [Cephalotus follicularis]
LLCWNSHGHSNPQAVQGLIKLIKSEGPKCVFLSEILIVDRYMQRVKVRLGFQNCMLVDPVGIGGRLALLWEEELDLSIQSYSKSHIEAIMKLRNGQEIWIFRFYGHPIAHQCHHIGSLMKELSHRHDIPWLCGRYFNEILCLRKMEGGNVRFERQMQDFL